MIKYKNLRWALLLVVVVHNFEEWMTFQMYRDFADTLPPSVFLAFEEPSWAMTQLALAMATLIPAIVVVWASTGPQRTAKDFGVCMVAGIFFANVFVPHVLAAIGNGGYAPGVVTAVLINFPFCLYLWRQAISEGILTTKQIVAAGIAGAATLIPALVLVYVLSFSILSAL